MKSKTLDLGLYTVLYTWRFARVLIGDALFKLFVLLKETPLI